MGVHVVNGLRFAGGGELEPCGRVATPPRDPDEGSRGGSKPDRQSFVIGRGNPKFKSDRM